MCECRVVYENNGEESEVMKDAATIKVKDGKMQLVNILGEVTEVNAELKELRFLEHKIVLKEK